MYNVYYKELETFNTTDCMIKKPFELFIGKEDTKLLTPTKNLHEDKTILKIGARILSFLNSPRTISSIWNSYLNFQNEESNNSLRIPFDLFILALDFLYMIDAIEYEDDLLWRKMND